MLLSEHELDLEAIEGHRDLLHYLGESVSNKLRMGFVPIRFVITCSDAKSYHCEVGGLSGLEHASDLSPTSLFEFVPRSVENTDRFNVALLVPTGIGAEVGGHAGDAAPVAKLLGEICDTLILHPNVVNGSDVNEMPQNALYVEGSVLTRLLMGTVGLQPVRANRVLVVLDQHKDEFFVSAAVNSVSSARAAYGLNCPAVVCLDPPIKMRARFASSGRAAGRVEEMAGLCQLLDERRGSYDAVAISSVIDVPPDFHLGYFEAHGKMINPWGGVEAILTHALSSIYNIPTAHSPMFESREIMNLDPGIVDPRMAPEAVSVTFLHCTLKGLQRSPKIITDQAAIRLPGVLSAADVSCLVIPDGCLGLPTLAALEQGIPVIAVRENRNVMKNDLTTLPWSPGQLHVVENYWEAVGVMTAMKTGIAPDSVRRPIADTVVEIKTLARQIPAEDSVSVAVEDKQ
ncbi:MAG: DUF3326 domain-containing protein [Planctomycetes bacterium]|nr:DUF3326 domain-containing protein [Planctomycetota bacterium]